MLKEQTSFELIACHCHSDLQIFAPFARHFRLDLVIFFVSSRARNFLVYLSIFVPVVRHFRFDLAILDFSIFWPVARLFRFDLAIFAPIAYHFMLRPIYSL